MFPANLYYQSSSQDFTLLNGDCIGIVQSCNQQFDMIFADPPYFLSNDGISLQNGKVVSVNKGDWDKSHGIEKDTKFNRKWISACRDKLKDNGTIWISGTHHNIFSVETCLKELGFKILNVIVWKKTNPPTNISCRYFTYSTEYIIWARKFEKIPHKFNYEVMKDLNGGRQMKDVWHLPAIAPWEKTCGKHPCQKPLSLLGRIILASTDKGDTILDPFAGSCTTGIAANLLGRNFVGIDQSEDYLRIGSNRRQEIEDRLVASTMLNKMFKFDNVDMVLVNHARTELYDNMIKQGICYVRAGDSKGSLMANPDFKNLSYVMLHTGGKNCRIFKLKKRGMFKIWTRETLEKYGFTPEHAPYYIVLEFDNNSNASITPEQFVKTGKYTYAPKLKPYSDFLIKSWVD